MTEIAIIASPRTTLSTVYGMNDLLASAGRDWDLITTGKCGDRTLKTTIVTVSGNDTETINNGWLKPHRPLSHDFHPDVVCILEIFVNQDDNISEIFKNEIAWLKNYWNNGGVIATACTGSLLLAEAGLLDGLEATVHWGFCNMMTARYPKIKVLPNSTFLVTGDSQRIIMVGGGSNWMDLGLYLIGRFISSQEAIRVAKIHLIQWHETGQQVYAYIGSQRQFDDAIIADCQVWLAQNYDQTSPVSAVIKKSGLPERTFIRRFKAATSMTPIEYVLNLRIEEAKQILETTDHPVESISEMVGYQDASFFNRKFRNKVSLTPSEYRKKFKHIHNILKL